MPESPVVDLSLTQQAWLDEVFADMMEFQPIGYCKYKYFADNLEKYLKWLDAKVGSKVEYAFTLTSNCTEDQYKAEEDRMINAAVQILRQQTCPTLEGEAYLEYTESGRPHIHGWYRCDKGHRIYQKIFKRYWPTWKEASGQGKGFQGGYHSVMKTNKYKGYASAEGRRVYPLTP